MPKSTFTDAHKVLVETLIAARKRAGVTQVELAKRLGRNQTLVSSIETGLRRVDIIEFAAIARAIGADPVSLYAEVVAKLPERFEV